MEAQAGSPAPTSLRGDAAAGLCIQLAIRDTVNEFQGHFGPT